VWNCDYDAEDLGYQFEGIASVHTCPNCEATFELVDNFNDNQQFIYVVPILEN
jgi:hypothetical protein